MKVDMSLGMWISLVMSYHTTPRQTISNVCTHQLKGKFYKVFSRKNIGNLTIGCNEIFNTEVSRNVNILILFWGHLQIF